MNFDWDDLRLFVAVARAGGLSAAARATGKSAPTLGRRMVMIERRMGRDLFRRLPRGYALTAEGEAFLAQCLEVEARVEAMTAGASAPALVKLSAGTWISHVLAQHAAELIGRERIALRFITANERLDIARREAVIGIRNSRPTEAGLAGRRVGRVRFAVYATDPGVTRWASVVGDTPSARWTRAQIGEEEVIEVTTGRLALDLALAGTARVTLPTFIGRDTPLIPLTAPIPELDHDEWLVSHHEDRFLPEVRRTIDRIHTILTRLHAQ
ncbi:DNA-binding transcriptional LysR family regulator [Rubricella aquisinus]|uniref:DNA-binding transcriptional LysR family regulator n=1 Tax=Rubricella aquisinus TaxID=2028108 RepID=A0A840WKE7_9RHOB|nr:LysR family transcriptional regulator [Rubricella aquisinus]MBB5515568.1 DNA-binding transcriptional LysR family regulator [Rubricella aquisinus]